jgi:hypothetical protein
MEDELSDNYNEDLRIDFAELDLNWRDHAANYMHWSNKWVAAVSERDRAKENLDVIKAEVDREIREAYSGKKPTEAAISALVSTNTRYREASDLLIDANEKVNLLASAKSAFEHQKKALEGLTQLWINGYWSEPKISGAAKEKLGNREEVYVEKQKTKLAGNKRLLERKR